MYRQKTFEVTPLVRFFSYRMRGNTLCPPQYFQCGVFFPRIVSSHSSGLLVERSRVVPRKKEIAFPQDISPDLFKDIAVEGIVLFHGVLGDNRKLSVLFISTSPHCLVTKLLQHTAWGNRRPLPPGLFVFWTAIFCWLWILFFRQCSEGKFVQFVSTKVCLRESALISTVLLRAGSDWLRGKATANVI